MSGSCCWASCALNVLTLAIRRWGLGNCSLSVLRACCCRVVCKSCLWNALECNLYSFSGVCLQLSSMQQVVREKDARFETQVRLHEDELLQLVTQSDVETEMQQVCCSNSVEWLSFWLTSNQDFAATCQPLPFPTALTQPPCSPWLLIDALSFVASFLGPDLTFPFIWLELGTLKLSLRGDLCGVSSGLASLSFICSFTPTVHALSLIQNFKLMKSVL